MMAVESGTTVDNFGHYTTNTYLTSSKGVLSHPRAAPSTPVPHIHAAALVHAQCDLLFLSKYFCGLNEMD